MSFKRKSLNTYKKCNRKPEYGLAAGIRELG